MLASVSSPRPGPRAVVAITPAGRARLDNPGAEKTTAELADDHDEGWEFLPDDECPEATAMWRDTFGGA